MASVKLKPSGMPKGWTRIPLQIPEVVAAKIDHARDQLPGRSLKLVGTAAMSVFAALPHETQDRLYRWAHRNELEHDRLNCHEALMIVLESPSEAEASR